MARDFPTRLQREESNEWNIAGNTATAGQTSTASVDVRSDGGGLWVATMSDIRIRDKADLAAWRATRQICNGGVVPINVFRLDLLAPFPAGGPTTSPTYAHTDATLFTDGTGYVEPVIKVNCPAGAALRATSMVIELVNCAALQGGEAFSILHSVFGWRMYEIATVEVDLDDSTLVTVTFNPPLRQRIEPGQEIEFDQPRCLMKLAAASAMNFILQQLPYSKASVKFVESRYG